MLLWNTYLFTYLLGNSQSSTQVATLSSVETARVVSLLFGVCVIYLANDSDTTASVDKSVVTWVLIRSPSRIIYGMIMIVFDITLRAHKLKEIELFVNIFWIAWRTCIHACILHSSSTPCIIAQLNSNDFTYFMHIYSSHTLCSVYNNICSFYSQTLHLYMRANSSGVQNFWKTFLYNDKLMSQSMHMKYEVWIIIIEAFSKITPKGNFVAEYSLLITIVFN